MMKGKPQHLYIKCIRLFILSKVVKSLLCERQTDRQIETAILSHKFFSWPYYTVLSSRLHLARLLLLGWGRGVFNRKRAVGHSVLFSKPYIYSYVYSSDKTYSTSPHLTLLQAGTDSKPTLTPTIMWTSAYIIS